MVSAGEPISPRLHERRERVFLILAGTSIGAMAMPNIIGITRFVHIGPLKLAVGVLRHASPLASGAAEARDVGSLMAVR